MDRMPCADGRAQRLWLSTCASGLHERRTRFPSGKSNLVSIKKSMEQLVSHIIMSAYYV